MTGLGEKRLSCDHTAQQNLALATGNGLHSGRYVISDGDDERYRSPSIPEDQRSGTLQQRGGDERIDDEATVMRLLGSPARTEVGQAQPTHIDQSILKML